jgi:hypothetical protein
MSRQRAAKFAALTLQLAVLLAVQLSCASPLGPTLARDMGVHHVALAERTRSGADAVAGTLHLFLKALRVGQGVIRLRGFAYFELPSDQPRFHLAAGYTVPWFDLNLTLVSGSETHRIQLEPSLAKSWLKYMDKLPSFQVDIKESAAAGCLMVVSPSNKRFGLHMLLDSAAEPAKDGGRPAFLHATRAMFGPILRRVGEAAAKLVAYYESIGVDGLVMYVYPEDWLSVRHDPELARLMASGKLRVVHWDALVLEHTTAPNGRKQHERVVMNHQLLAFWGTNTYLFLWDFDEFIALPTPGSTLPGLLESGCLRNYTRCAHLTRYNFYPPARAEFVPLNTLTLKQTPHIDEKVYMLPSLAFSPGVHHASECLGDSAPQCSAGAFCSVSLCQTHRPCPYVPESCAFIVHNVNIMGTRIYAPKSLTQSTEWQWMYPLKQPGG